MKKIIKLKEEEIANATMYQKANDFRKKNKKRLLPDVFYLRWEIELLFKKLLESLFLNSFFLMGSTTF
ncbi:MAG TPA: hypothetical protein VIJ95_14595 [Hanamia sp.]